MGFNYTPGIRLPPYISFQNPDVPAQVLEKSRKKSQSTISAEGGVIPIVYGTQRVGGKVFIITTGAEGKIIVGTVFCEGEVDAIVSFDIDDKTVENTESASETYLGTTTQTASPLIVSAIPSYTDTLRYTIAGSTEIASTCYAVIKAGSKKSSGFPRLAAIIRGKKIYDPRDANQTFGVRTTYKYSNNPALCIADLITSKVYGLGKSVDWASVKTTANFNDQYVGSPQEVSRQLDIVLDNEQEVTTWIETLRAYASCFVIEENGIYLLIPDKPIGYAANFTGASTSNGTFPYVAAQAITSELSFEVSVKADAALTAASSCIFAKGTAASTNQFGLYHDKSTNITTVSIRVGGVNNTFTFSNVMPTASYQTISVSYRGVSAVGGNTATTIAVNGATVTVTGSTFGTMTNTTDNILLGYITGSNGFKGQVDEFRMWNRYRPLTEIVSNYSKAIVTKFDPSLVAQVSFNEGYDSKNMATSTTTWTAASIAADLTGNTTGVTLVPTPTYGTASSNWSQYDNPADFFRFDQNNILDKTTKFKRRGVAQSPTIVEITFTDQTSKPWRDDYAILDQSQSSMGNGKRRKSNVVMQGITRYTQAYREAIERYNNIVSDSTVTFGAWDDAYVLQVGDGIQFHHPTIETWNPGTQTYTELFKPYRTTSIRERDGGKFDITAIEYDPANYSTTVATAPTYPDTNLPKIIDPPAVSNINASEKLYKNNDGVWGSRISATITPSVATVYPYNKGFLVKLYRNTGARPLIEQIIIRPDAVNPATGTVEYLSSVLNPFLDTDTITSTAWYQLEVYTVSVIDVLSPKLQVDVAVLGKFLKPSNITGFTGFEVNNKVLLKWDEAVDIDVWRYDLRYYAAAGATDTATLITAYATATKVDLQDSLTYLAEGIGAGTWRFLVSAVDSLGNYSTVPAFVDVVVTLDLDAYGFISRTYTDWFALGMSNWTVRDVVGPYWSTDWADPWYLNEATASNQTATFGITTSALENTHSTVLTFDGTTASPYISIPRIAAHDAAATIYTIEAYIYVNGAVSGRQTIFSTRQGDVAGSWAFEIGKGSGTSTDTGRLVLAGLGTTVIRESTNGAILENTWQHVLAKVSGTAAGNTQLYVDGVEVIYNGAGTIYTSAFNTNAKIIGSLNNTPANIFNGNIKRVKWYSVALTDVNRLKSAEYYNNDVYSIASLIGAWMIKEGTGTTITDGAAVTSTGTISNTPLWTTTSYLMTESWDYGTVITGTWSANINVTDHTGVSVKYVLTSVDGVTWVYNIGSTVKATGRYIRAYIQTTGNMTINGWPVMSLILEPKTETTPIIRTSASTGVLVQLINQYTQVKTLLATPVSFGVDTGTGTTAASISAVADRILVAPVTGLKFTGEVTAGTLSDTAVVSTASYAVSASNFLEFDLWLAPDSVDPVINARAIVTYSSAAATTCSTTWNAGTWVSCKTAITNTSVIASITLAITSSVVGVHSIVIRNLRATDGAVTLFTFWNNSGEPTPNTIVGSMLNKKCGPANSFMLYAFKTAAGTTTQIASDVTIKFEGS